MRRKNVNFRSNQNKSAFSPNGAFIDFLKRWWFVILSMLLFIVFVIPIVKRWVEAQKLKTTKAEMYNALNLSNTENNLNSPVIQQKKSSFLKTKYPLVDSKKWKELNTNAQRMAVALGTDPDNNHRLGVIDLYNVSAWKEDETTAVSIAKKHSGTFPILAELYYTTYTKSRNLKNDLLKYLSKDDLAEIRASHLKNGGYKYI